MQTQLALVKEVMAQVYPDGPLEVEDPEAHTSHPLNGLGMLRRMGHQLRGPTLGRLGPLFGQAGRGGGGGGLENLRRISDRIREAARHFPDGENYKVGISGVTLLQEAYGLNITSLARGEVRVGGRVFRSDFRPSWREMVELGYAAYDQGWMDTSIEWFEEALLRTKAEAEAEAAVAGKDEVDRLSAKIATVKGLHDKMLDKLGPVSHRHRCNPLPFDNKLARKKKYKKAKTKKKKEKKKKGRGGGGKLALKVYNRVALFSEVESHQKLSDNFKIMCGREGRLMEGGEEKEEEEEEEDEDAAALRRPPELDGRLRCYFHHQGLPHLRLAPFPLEERSEFPFVAVLHGFLHQREMTYLRHFASDRLFRSKTGYSEERRTSLMRTSKQTWMEERFFHFDRALVNGSSAKVAYDPRSYEPPPTPFEPMRYVEVKDKVGFAVARRIEAATRLDVLGPFSSESYQIANYGLGGQYSTHHDSNGFFEGTLDRGRNPDQFRHNAGVGDRFVTVMGYLSEVDVGGTTIFPLAGVRSPVEKGAAVLWFNLLADGRRDKWTYHGGCPVVVGSKWITNKWVFYNDQFREYPCTLRHGDRHAVLSRWRRASAISLPDGRKSKN